MGERLFRILGLADDDLIEEAASSAAASKRRSVRRSGLGLAACLALVCLLGFGWQAARNMGYGGANSGSSAGASGAGGGGHDGGAVFMSYAGPVFPLTALEGASGLTAERNLTWDFAPGAYADGEPRQWGAAVTDRYILSNPTEEDSALVLLYPFAGSFRDLGELRPAVTVNGTEISAELYAGAYSGGFQSAMGESDPNHDTLNLATLNSWEQYQTLLEDGSYQARALADYPALDIPVTVYEFSEFRAPLEQYPAATQAVSFTIDQNATRILCYGFEGQEWDWDSGFRRYSYFVPDGVTQVPRVKLLAVLGEDIKEYVLQGYQNGGCDNGEEIEGVSCTVTRSETTLDEVLNRLCRAYTEQYAQGRAADQENAFHTVSFSMYRGAAAELLAQYGPLSGKAMDRYGNGRLDDILAETLIHDRVLYLAFSAVVPAGGSVEVTARLWKSPSHDFYCSGSENVGIQGYDLVTGLGSSLNFTRQTAALENAETIEIVRQNLGFDPENGVDKVELDLNRKHYYLEIRERR